jgi:NTP pyrophosphatase (non-canonical NTP hydrolase)
MCGLFFLGKIGGNKMMTDKAIARMAREKKRIRRVNEILDLLQEECGEVVQIVSKCRRFGLEEKRENLVQEIADVMLLVELLKANELFTDKEIHKAQLEKSTKLKKWSTIYED